MLKALHPVASCMVSNALYTPRCQFECEVKQAAIHIAVLERSLEGVPLDFLPGVLLQAGRQRQLSYLAGRLCAEHAMRSWGEETLRPICRGKSCEPLWPGGWTGSISHTASHAFAAVMPRVGPYDIGIDAEAIFDDRTRHDVLHVCACDHEVEVVASESKKENLAATVLFAAKEAYYKAVYGALQRFVGFEEVLLSSLDLTSGKFELVPRTVAKDSCGLPSASGRFVVESGMVRACVAPA